MLIQTSGAPNRSRLQATTRELDLGYLEIDTVTTKYMKIRILSNSITNNSSGLKTRLKLKEQKYVGRNPSGWDIKKGWNLHIKVWASTACRQIVKLLGWLYEIHLPWVGFTTSPMFSCFDGRSPAISMATRWPLQQSYPATSIMCWWISCKISWRKSSACNWPKGCTGMLPTK